MSVFNMPCPTCGELEADCECNPTEPLTDEQIAEVARLHDGPGYEREDLSYEEYCCFECDEPVPCRTSRLAAEVTRLRRWKAEALPVIDGLQELGKALGLPLGTQITGPDAVKAVERLRTALADEWEPKGKPSVIGWIGNPYADALRALLEDQ